MTPKQSKRTAPTPDDLIGTAEAAQMLGKTPRTIQRMVREKRLKGYMRPVKGRGKPALLVDRREVEELKQTVIEIQPEDAE